VTAHERVLDPQAQLQDALDLSFRFLARRDRTVAEVRRHLERRRVEPAAIDGAVAELERQGYLDDARFARRFAQDRQALDGWGAERIERRLLALGVAADDAAVAVADRAPEEERAAALALLRQRRVSPPRTDHERERTLAVLVRRGCELELAHDVVRAFERAA
jgi:regulatory protein